MAVDGGCLAGFVQTCKEGPKNSGNLGALFLRKIDPDLLFLAFLKTPRKIAPKKQRLENSCRTPKFPGKEGENGPKSKEFLEKQKSKEVPKDNAKKIRGNSKKSFCANLIISEAPPY